MTKIMCPSREEACILSIILILILNAAGADWPDCGFQCQAGDVTVMNMWVGDAQGNPLSSCSPGGQVSAYLWAKIVNNANSPRYAVILLADIYVNGVLKKSLYADGGLCVLDAISPKASTTRPFYSFTWSCGQTVKIRSLILSWETAQGTSCSNALRKCSNRGTKCYAGAETEKIGRAHV